ncbi:MAG: hypothetical protein JO034_03525, partial [Singulisphaera sp.]|nr:hypothetical protein [Singulisphaera sp.]
MSTTQHHDPNGLPSSRFGSYDRLRAVSRAGAPPDDDPPVAAAPPSPPDPRSPEPAEAPTPLAAAPADPVPPDVRAAAPTPQSAAPTSDGEHAAGPPPPMPTCDHGEVPG